jgi:hypothetical protein
VTATASAFASEAPDERWASFSGALLAGLSRPVPSDYVPVTAATVHAAIEICQLLAGRPWPTLLSFEVRREPEGEIAFELRGPGRPVEFSVETDGAAFDFAVEEHASGEIRGKTFHSPAELLQEVQLSAA